MIYINYRPAESTVEQDEYVELQIRLRRPIRHAIVCILFFFFLFFFIPIRVNFKKSIIYSVYQRLL